MSLGNYPEVSLREARALRDEARALVAKDINPRIHRKQKRAAVKLAGENTFDAIYEKWLAHRELGLKKGRQTTLSILPRVFAKDVLPFLGKRSIYEIKRPDLLEVIARIERRQALSVAEKVRAWFNQMFGYALVVVPGLEQNHASHLEALNEIRYPKVWVDAQLSHVDPHKVSATYNHAEYVEQPFGLYGSLWI